MVYFIELICESRKTVHAYTEESQTICGQNLNGKQYEYIFDPLFGEICEDCSADGSMIQIDCDQYFLQIETFEKAKKKLQWMKDVYLTLTDEQKFNFELAEAIGQENASFINFLNGEDVRFQPIPESGDKLQIDYSKGDLKHSIEVDYHGIERVFLDLKEFIFDEMVNRRN